MANSRQSRNRKYLKKLARSLSPRIGKEIGASKRIKARATATFAPLSGATQTAHCGKEDQRPEGGW